MRVCEKKTNKKGKKYLVIGVLLITVLIVTLFFSYLNARNDWERSHEIYYVGSECIECYYGKGYDYWMAQVRHDSGTSWDDDSYIFNENDRTMEIVGAKYDGKGRLVEYLTYDSFGGEHKLSYSFEENEDGSVTRTCLTSTLNYSLERVEHKYIDVFDKNREQVSHDFYGRQSGQDSYQLVESETYPTLLLDGIYNDSYEWWETDDKSVVWITSGDEKTDILWIVNFDTDDNSDDKTIIADVYYVNCGKRIRVLDEFMLGSTKNEARENLKEMLENACYNEAGKPEILLVHGTENQMMHVEIDYMYPSGRIKTIYYDELSWAYNAYAGGYPMFKFLGREFGSLIEVPEKDAWNRFCEKLTENYDLTSMVETATGEKEELVKEPEATPGKSVEEEAATSAESGTTSIAGESAEAEAPVIEPLSYEIVSKREEYLQQADTNYDYYFSLEYPVFAGDGAERLNVFVQNHIMDAETYWAIYGRHDYFDALSVRIMMENEQWICLEVYRKEHSGAANGSAYAESYVFDKAAGEVVPIEQILSKYGITEVAQVSDYMADKYAGICATTEERTVIKYISSDHSRMKELCSNVLSESGRWGLDEDGLYIYGTILDVDSSDGYELSKLSYDELLAVSEENEKCTYYVKTTDKSSNSWAKYPVFEGRESYILNAWVDTMIENDYDSNVSSGVSVTVTVDNKNYIGLSAYGWWYEEMMLHTEDYQTFCLLDKSTWEIVEISEMLKKYNVTVEKLATCVTEKFNANYKKSDFANSPLEPYDYFLDRLKNNKGWILNEEGIGVYAGKGDLAYYDDGILEFMISFAELEKQ